MVTVGDAAGDAGLEQATTPSVIKNKVNIKMAIRGFIVVSPCHCRVGIAGEAKQHLHRTERSEVQVSQFQLKPRLLRRRVHPELAEDSSQ
jgi:hypothetical protein